MAATLEDVKSKTFDYIIVGGGAAGLTLAARLSEDADKTVCVLEAGDANLNDPAILRPGGYATHFGNEAYDWAHETTKQKLLNDRVCALNSGRGLGGSSAINFMIYTKPQRAEIDDFERLGNPGWNWKNFQKYVQKSEGYVEPPLEFKKEVGIPDVTGLGRDGPLSVAFPPVASGLEPVMREAMLKIGVPPAPDPFGGNTTGIYLTPNTRDPRTQSRSYSVTAHYLPNADRRNLIVLVKAHVNRIITKEDAGGNFTATGVEFEYDDQLYTVHTNREVILSAGSMRSPQLLELSGIGQKDVLKKIGVPVKIDLPGVGENMQEHVLNGVSFELSDETDYTTFDVLRDPKQLAKQVELYESGQGVFTMGIIEFAFLPLETISPQAKAIYESAKNAIAKMDPKSTRPGVREQLQMQLNRIAPGASDPAPECEIICFPGMLSQPNPPAEGKKYFTINFSLNQLLSRGSIHAVSNDPTHVPDIDPRYFEQNVDLQVFREMVKFARRLATVSPLKDILVSELNPGPKIQTDEEIQEWLKQTFMTTWHTASTCSMLPREKSGVVDHNLKVYGTNNLRVVDVSVVPLHISAHTQALAYSIAEQAADIIRGRFKA